MTFLTNGGTHVHGHWQRHSVVSKGRSVTRNLSARNRLLSLNRLGQRCSSKNWRRTLPTKSGRSQGA